MKKIRIEIVNNGWVVVHSDFVDGKDRLIDRRVFTRDVELFKYLTANLRLNPHDLHGGEGDRD